MLDPVKTALVGYGYAGKTIHAPLIRAAQGLELTTVVSSRPNDVLTDIPGMYVSPTLDVALNDLDVDLIVIATPNDLHAPQAHAALDAGKHVVIDKPFALNDVEARDLIEHAHKAQRTLSVFHCRRWDSNHLTFKAVRDRLGDIYQFILRYDRWRPVVRDRWRERAGPGSGIWYDLGSHLLDQAMDLFGWPDWIIADIAGQRPGASTDDYFHVTLGYGRLRVLLHSSMMTAAAGPVMEAQGSGGSFVKYGMDVQEEMLKAGRTPGYTGWGLDPVPARLIPVTGDAPGTPEQADTLPGNYLAYYEGIARTISESAPNPVPAEDARKVMRLLDLGFQSAKQGRRLPCRV
jgi:predicted dehydrogenase